MMTFSSVHVSGACIRAHYLKGYAVSCLHKNRSILSIYVRYCMQFCIFLLNRAVFYQYIEHWKNLQKQLVANFKKKSILFWDFNAFVSSPQVFWNSWISRWYGHWYSAYMAVPCGAGDPCASRGGISMRELFRWVFTAVLLESSTLVIACTQVLFHLLILFPQWI